MEFSLEQIAGILEGTVDGDSTLKVYRLDKIQEGQPGGIAFLANDKYEAYLYETAATAVIVSENFIASKPHTATLIRVKDAYTGFTTLLEAYNQVSRGTLVGVEEPSYLGENSLVGGGAYRGAFSYIGKDCVLGEGVKIHAHAFIGDRVKIGDGTVTKFVRTRK